MAAVNEGRFSKPAKTLRIESDAIRLQRSRMLLVVLSGLHCHLDERLPGALILDGYISMIVVKAT
jgi:hypothetical protein